MKEEMKNKLQELTRWPVISEQTISKCVEYLKEGKTSISSGDILDEFEKSFKEYTGSKFCLAQNNGTSALFSAYYALGLGPGDEVIVPSFTWTATVTAMLPLGVEPVFCDIDPYTWTIDPEDLERKITAKTKAVCIVHMWGNVCDMDRINKIVDENHLFLVEDCSHAHGAFYNRKHVGTFGDIGCFSMQATKPLSGGELGAVITNNSVLYDKMVKLGHQGRIDKLALTEESKKFVGGLGYKFRPFPLALVIARDHLYDLSKITSNRRKMATYFDRELSTVPRINTQKCLSGVERTLYYYVFQIDIPNSDLDELVCRLNSLGFPLKKMHYQLVHRVPPFSDCDVSLPVSEEVIGRLVVLEVINTDSDILLKTYAKEFADEIRLYMNKKYGMEE